MFNVAYLSFLATMVSTPAHFLDRRHSSDLAARQQARGTYRLVLVVIGNRVDRILVELVELDAAGLALLDEDGKPDRRRDRFGFLPVEQRDLDHVLARHIVQPTETGVNSWLDRPIVRHLTSSLRNVDSGGGEP